jgi:AraC family transcriptional regulator
MSVRESTRESYQERVLRALVSLERDIDREPRLEDLARGAHLSPFHFHRVFSAVVGESPVEYVRRLRLERAAHELRQSTRQVQHVAREAGYGSHEAFTRAFRARFGVAPSAFRRLAEEALPRGDGGAARRGRVEVLRPIRVAFIRHVGPYELAPMAWGRLMTWAGSSTQFRRSAGSTEPLLLGVPHDNPSVTPPERLRFDCCVAVDDRVRPEGEIGVQDVAGGAYACAVHRGPFERLAETYVWIAASFIPEAGYRMRRAPFLELYLTPPERTPPEELLTEVFVPVIGQSRERR